MQLDDLKLSELLESIAAKTPTPGGGAVASVTLGTAAALAEMVVNYSIGKKALASHDSLHQRAIRELQSVRIDSLRLARDDAQAYAALSAVLKMKEDDPRRARDLPGAVDGAIQPPMEILRVSIKTLEVLQELCGKTSAMLNSDLAIAAILADAAARAAAWNVRINVPLVANAKRASDLNAFTEQSIAKAAALHAQVEQRCQAGP